MNELSVSGPIVIRSNIDAKNNYHEYRDILRFDFCCSCSYCTLTEVEAFGIRFEIDHYYPQKHYPDLINEYNNLFWSCEICNNYKSNYTPDDEDLKIGNVILRIDNNDPRDHYELRNDSLYHKSHMGDFNINLLLLNRLNLRRIRQIRQRFLDATEYIAFGISRIKKVKLGSFNTPKQRIWFLRIKQEIFQRHSSISEFLKEFPICSALLEADPEKQKNLKKRRKYLEEQKAIKIKNK